MTHFTGRNELMGQIRGSYLKSLVAIGFYPWNILKKRDGLEYLLYGPKCMNDAILGCHCSLKGSLYGEV